MESAPVKPGPGATLAEDGSQNPLPAAHPSTAPSLATESVLKPSDPLAEGSREVKGIDFNDHAEHPVTVEQLVAGMSTMGFQASAVGEAVRIINDMVDDPSFNPAPTHQVDASSL